MKCGGRSDDICHFAMSRGKYWCFTVNNYTDEEERLVRGLEQDERITYLVCGREEGETGTPHLQGYLELGGRLRLRQLKQLPGLQRGHFELRRGTQAQAATYCKKAEDFFEFGTPTTVTAGQRNDLKGACEAIKAGATASELWASHTSTMVKYHAGLKLAITALQPKRQRRTFPLTDYPWHPLVFGRGSVVICGPSGIGKTSYIRSLYPDYLWVSHMDDLTSFEDHEGIIFDDMSFTHLPRTAQIHLLDYDDDRSIHVRYQTAKIPAGTQKFFLTNTEYIFDLEDKAIARRVEVIRLEGTYVVI